jgi:hypothetical protein
MENNTRRSLALVGSLVLLALFGLRLVQVGIGEARGNALPADRLYAPQQIRLVQLEAAPLTWLQSELSAVGMLATSEYLERAIDPQNLNCRMAVRATQTGRIAGWLCTDTVGLYRTNG